MIYSVIGFKDKQVNLFTTPGLSNLKDHEEIKEDVRIQIVKSDKRQIFKGKNLVIYGTFDSATGKYDVHDPEFLLNCDEVISECDDYERRKKDGQEEA